MTEENDIQEEMKELGIDPNGEGEPQVFMSGPMLTAIAGVLIALLVAGFLLLVF